MTKQERILRVIESANKPVRGSEIAAVTGLTRKSVEDALFWLCKKQLIVRGGRRRQAGWSIRQQPKAISSAQLQGVFDAMCRV